MLAEISNVFTQVITWLGEFLSALTGETGALAALWPLMAISIGVSVLMVCIKIVRRIVWGA